MHERKMTPEALLAMPVHPACAAFPPMSVDELNGLVDDIKANGQRKPVTVREGVLVDGRHRIKACFGAGVDVRVVDYDGGPDVAKWVFSENLHRRSLDKSQRAMMAGRWVKHFAVEAKRRQGSAQACADAGGGKKASEEAAGVIGGVSPRSVDSAKVVLEHGTPELVAAVDSGAISVSLAADVAKLDPGKQSAALVDLKPKAVSAALRREKKRAKNEGRVAAARAAAPAIKGIEIRHCGNEALLASLEAGDAGLVAADPNWDYDNNQNGGAAKQYGLSGMEGIIATLDEAWGKAAEDCYLLMWCTFPQLWDFIVAANDAGPDFRWAPAITGAAWGKRLSEGDRKGAGYHIRGDAEVALLFKKGSPRPLDGHNYLSNWHASERTEHSEKPVEWLAEAVESYCPEGGLVVELWGGLCPTARACATTGRRCVSAEIDEERHGLAVAALVEHLEEDVS